MEKGEREKLRLELKGQGRRQGWLQESKKKSFDEYVKKRVKSD